MVCEGGEGCGELRIEDDDVLLGKKIVVAGKVSWMGRGFFVFDRIGVIGGGYFSGLSCV